MYFAASILFFLAAKSEATADPAMVAAAALPGSWNDTVCWKASYGRGAGRPLHTCAPDQQKSGALCYKPCDNTTTPPFKGVGPVCWQGCKPDYKDEGALCRHRNSLKTYAKKTYGRGVGHILQCRDGEERSGLLCYPPCKPGYVGHGPVCWQGCPAKNPTDGGALCCRNKLTCTAKITSLCAGIPMAVGKCLTAGVDPLSILSAAQSSISAVLGFVMPICKNIVDPDNEMIAQNPEIAYDKAAEDYEEITYQKMATDDSFNEL
mmetsp:Transcript_10784/g.19662  ORF Transcript_10784/g.19662 Transcript_10784/m.19662 type:complete len:263 (-) Transcript_10784:251-1039(-)|eukprot:CAMPEP_0197531590 /NCGR_PEP_ID=MMETSP1318-20131121/36348_1 /TAXON_ID=552666 /ORGANISM="Partenskyella glossopodia, Strain RCC365" /LENGTH=262 /DNA_ID=CAMNT_0043087873 /DNA_START=27 /DNA_END=815 /DNA_ORIENTATION=-